jgi:hypothetical protein
MADPVDWIFVLVTGVIAYHGLAYRNADRERDLVRTLFGCIALLSARPVGRHPGADLAFARAAVARPPQGAPTLGNPSGTAGRKDALRTRNGQLSG